MQKYYRILGVPYDASLDEIKKAYKNLVKVWHPDRFGKDDQLGKLAQEKLVEINEAYTMLRSITPGTFTDVSPKAPPKPESKQQSPPEEKKNEPAPKAKGPASGAPQHKGGPSARTRNWHWYYSIIIASVMILSVIAVASFNRGDDSHADDPLPQPTLFADQLSNQPLGREMYFGVGSTKEEVLAIQGSPTEVTDGTWQYGNSRVYFEDGRVANWYTSPADPLHVQMVPVGSDIESKGYFSIGSTKEEVMAIQGSPTEFNESTWRYGNSMVQFEYGRVSKWYESAANPLHVKGFVVDHVKSKDYYTVGCTKDDVLIAQGMPSEFSEQVWRYGFSMVYFENGRLTKWYESPATPLRIKAQAAKSSTKPKEFFMIGSTKDDVLNVQGTPTQFTDDVWRYGSSMVYFEGGHVANCYNSPANPIKARLDAVPAPNTEKRYFTLGSSKEEVLAIQGVPTQFTETVWLYGSSRVSFENDRVVSWYESPTNPLNAHMEQANLTQ